jgi:hypothetical protein
MTGLTVRYWEWVARAQRSLPAADGGWNRHHSWAGCERPQAEYLYGLPQPRLLPRLSRGRFEHEDKQLESRQARMCSVLGILKTQGVHEILFAVRLARLRT